MASDQRFLDDATPAAVAKSLQTNDRLQTGQALTIAGAHFVHDTYQSFLPPMLPLFISNLAISRADAGFLTVFLQWPSILQPFVGYLADRVSLRFLVILAPAITGATMSLMGVAPGYAVLAILLLFSGLSSSGLHAVGPAMLGEVSGRTLGRGMSFWMVAGESARTVGPLVIVTAIRFMPLEHTPWLMVGGLAASLVLFFRLRGALRSPARAAPNMPWKKALRTMAPVLIPVSVIIALRAFLDAAMVTYLPTFLHEEGADLWLAGISLSVLEAAGIFGALVGGPLSDRFGRKAVLAVALLIAPFFMLGFLTTSGGARFPLLLLLGFTALSINPVIMAIVQEDFPENRALANSIYMVDMFAIRSTVIVIVGALADHIGMRPAFYACAVIGLLCVPVLFTLPGRHAAALRS